MKVLTEIELRTILKNTGTIAEYKVPPGTILTPAARSFLAENRIDLIFSDEQETSSEEGKRDADSNLTTENGQDLEQNAKYFLMGAGVKISEKPEAYTHLYANNLVPKYHPRIKLRGKIDALEAQIIIAQVKANENKLEEMTKDLEEILTLARNILRAEVLSEPLADFTLLGLTEQGLREVSHNPKKTLGVGHFVPSQEMGEMMAYLNLIRTQVRETEIYAVEAFFNPTEGLQREDLIKALNRMSSAVYVMMCRLKAGQYQSQRFKS